jgi:glycosyltransferase involved in cell wall biosynthesis
MKICHITTVHPSKDARIFYRMCSGLAARGHEVTLIAPGPFMDEVGVSSSPWNDRIAPAGRVSRVILALRAALSESADIYHFHDPELIILGLALKLLKPSKTVVYDVHEDYPSMMLEKYWIPRPVRPLISNGMKIANRIASLCLDGIVTADPGVQSDFRKTAKDRSLVYYNFPVPELFKSTTNGIIKADLIYIGGMSERSGIFVLLEALALLAKKGLHPTAKLAGYTDGERGRVAIEEAIRNKGLESQVHLQGRIPHSEVPNWIRSGRVGLVMLQPIPKFMKNIPSKLFEYWACGRAVIASDLPPIRPFVAHRRNGLVFSPTDPESLALAIQYVIEHPAEAEQMGHLALAQVVGNWNNEYQIARLVKFYEKILKISNHVVEPLSETQSDNGPLPWR